MNRSDINDVLCCEADANVFINVQRQNVSSGGHVVLKPGESITLKPCRFHSFWTEGKEVLVGEVSSSNNDTTDNLFLNLSWRFPKIAEDALPFGLLVGDCKTLLDNISLEEKLSS